MTVFILNDKLIRTDLPRGSTLLDFIRYNQGLSGTKIGCREGDCGACTVLEGNLEDVEKVMFNNEPGGMNSSQEQGTTGNLTKRIRYRSIVSCLTPLGNAHGKHIVTIEGLNMHVLSPVQQAFVDYNGTQCGFCTPGFVVSLTGHAINDQTADARLAIASMDGNICRCTGYKSIERVAVSISRLLKEKDPANPIGWLVENGFLPSYFLDIPERIIVLKASDASGYISKGIESSAELTDPDVQQTTDKEYGNLAGGQAAKYENITKSGNTPEPHQVDSSNKQQLTEGGRISRPSGEPSIPVQIIGGGTDLMVQRPDDMAEHEPLLVFENQALKGIRQENNRVVIGAAATASDIMTSEVMASLIHGIKSHFKLVSSDPIRNMGTLGGNLVNASPIADLSIFFLPWDAALTLEDWATKKRRTVALKDFFLDYKRLDLLKDEMVMSLSFPWPAKDFLFNFEKVSKRTYLDIASVNSAIYLETEDEMISTCRISCGGVAPVPLYLRETSAFLSGKAITADTVKEANDILQQEITPISDVRGNADYKRLLARQLLFAHFLKLFPDNIEVEDLKR
jgi:xanthine dehydrogenase small subunit